MLIWVPDAEYEKAETDEAAFLNEAIEALARPQMEALLKDQGFSIAGSEGIDALRRMVRLAVRAEELTSEYVRRFQQKKP